MFQKLRHWMTPSRPSLSSVIDGIKARGSALISEDVNNKPHPTDGHLGDIFERASRDGIVISGNGHFRQIAIAFARAGWDVCEEARCGDASVKS